MQLFKLFHALAAVGAVSLASCGGGGEPVPPPAEREMVIESQSAFDGYVTAVSGIPDSATTSGEILIGDEDVVNWLHRGFLRFKLNLLPANIQVVSARLEIHQTSGNGQGDPYGKYGPLMVKHLRYTGSLDVDAFDWPEEPTIDAELAKNMNAGVKDADVSAAVQADVAAGEFAIEFRLQFRDDEDPALHDLLTDTTMYASTDNISGQGTTPKLVVTYIEQ